MSRFIYPSYILSEDRKTLLYEMSNDWYKDLVKTIAVEDNEILELFIDNMLENLFYEKSLKVTSLTNVDKLYMLLCIRSYCIGPQIIFTTKVPRKSDDGKKEDIKVDVPLNLNEVLNRLGNYPFEHTYTFEESGIIVKGTLPKKFYYTDIHQVVADSLTSIKTAGNSIDITQFSIDERINIMNTLPSALFPRIVEYLKEQEDRIKDDPIISFNTKMELPFGNKLDLQLYNGAVGEIIKMLFNTNLKELYTNEYTLMRRFKFTFNAIQQCTPQELNVYYEIIHNDLEREKKEQQEQQKGFGGGDFMAPPKNLQPE